MRLMLIEVNLSSSDRRSSRNSDISARLASLAYERNARVFILVTLSMKTNNRNGWNIERVNDFTELAGGNTVVVNPTIQMANTFCEYL